MSGGMASGFGSRLGWALAIAGLVAGSWLLGWRGALLALSAIVFWLLLQFSQLMRLMRAAQQTPVGQVQSAAMLQSRLRTGLKLIDVLALTRSLGQRTEGGRADRLQSYAWSDAGGDRIELRFEAGRLSAWQLQPADRGTATDKADTVDDAPGLRDVDAAS